MGFLIPLALLAWAVAFGFAAARAAVRLDRTASVWFGFGAVLGPIALMLLRAAPPGRCRSCDTPTRGWLRTCWWCGADVRSTPATTREIVARMSGHRATAGGALRNEVPGGLPPARLPRIQQAYPAKEAIADATSEPSIAATADVPLAAAPRPVGRRPLAHDRNGSPASFEKKPDPAEPAPPSRNAPPSRKASPSRMRTASTSADGTPAKSRAEASTPTPAPAPAKPAATSTPQARAQPVTPQPAMPRAAPPEPRLFQPPLFQPPSLPEPPVSQPPRTQPVAPASTPPRSNLSEQATTLLATAVYITGSTRLDAGRRYGLGLRGSRLQILGPTDIDPDVVVLDHPLQGLEATALEGRLIVSDANGKSGFVVVFMSIVGAGTEALAATIQSSAEAATRIGRPDA